MPAVIWHKQEITNRDDAWGQTWPVAQIAPFASPKYCHYQEHEYVFANMNRCFGLYKHGMDPSIRRKLRLKRPLSPRSQPRKMSSTTILPIQNCRVRSNSVIPNHHCTLLPLHSRMHICAKRDVLIQEVEEVVGFFLFETYDTAGLTFISSV